MAGPGRFAPEFQGVPVLDDHDTAQDAERAALWPPPSVGLLILIHRTAKDIGSHLRQSRPQLLGEVSVPESAEWRAQRWWSPPWSPQTGDGAAGGTDARTLVIDEEECPVSPDGTAERPAELVLAKSADLIPGDVPVLEIGPESVHPQSVPKIGDEVVAVARKRHSVWKRPVKIARGVRRCLGKLRRPHLRDELP
jgi:hypothetical protein